MKVKCIVCDIEKEMAGLDSFVCVCGSMSFVCVQGNDE